MKILRKNLKVIGMMIAFMTLFASLVPLSEKRSSAYSPGFDRGDMIIYQILTDRFYDGDYSNNDQGNGEYIPEDLRFYQGGDWQGIIDSWDYIQNLGVTAIWLSPVCDNEDLSKDESSAGYHGYWTRNFYGYEPHFGTKDCLKELVSTANDNGINVIIDIVPNHVADYFGPEATEYDPFDYGPTSPFDNPDWYHHNGDVTDWDDLDQLLNYDIFGLDDLAQENADVEDELTDVFTTIRDESECTAFRVDAVKHMPSDFLDAFQYSLGIPCIGEVYSRDPAEVSEYLNYGWGVFDYPMYYTINDVFAKEESCYKLRDRFEQDSYYSNTSRLVTFVDNHDQIRFLRRASFEWDRLKLALTFIMTIRGTCIYYGTERGYSGTGDADYQNRENLQDWDQDHELYLFIQKLIDIRKSHGALYQGDYYEIWVDDLVFSYLRKDGSDEVIIVLNNDGDDQTRTIPIRTESDLEVGMILVNQLNMEDRVIIERGGVTDKQITVRLSPKESRIYVPE